jgi:hypothetical protein
MMAPGIICPTPPNCIKGGLRHLGPYLRLHQTEKTLMALGILHHQTQRRIMTLGDHISCSTKLRRLIAPGIICSTPPNYIKGDYDTWEPYLLLHQTKKRLRMAPGILHHQIQRGIMTPGDHISCSTKLGRTWTRGTISPDPPN